MNIADKKICKLASDILNGKKPSEEEIQQLASSVLGQAQVSNVKKRKFGHFAGKINLHDDFDAELPETFWLGKAE